MKNLKKQMENLKEAVVLPEDKKEELCRKLENLIDSELEKDNSPAKSQKNPNKKDPIFDESPKAETDTNTDLEPIHLKNLC